MQYKNLLRILLVVCLSVFLASCSQSIDTQNTEIFIPYLDDNLLDGQTYIPYEKTEREFEGIGDYYILESPDGYNCDNIEKFARLSSFIDVSVSLESPETLCDSWQIYRGHTVMSFVYYNRGFESLPRLGYKMLFFHPERGYIDYIIPEEDLDFKYYADIQLQHINQKVSEGAEFSNEKWGELYDDMDIWFKKDFNHQTDGDWIRDENEKLRNYIQEYLVYFYPFGYPEITYPGITHFSDQDDLAPNCSNLFHSLKGYDVEEFNSTLCNIIDDGKRRLIYFFYLSNNSMFAGGPYYSLEKDVYLLDMEFGYLRILSNEFGISSNVDDKDKILSYEYLYSKDAKQQFLSFDKYIKGKYLK